MKMHDLFKKTEEMFSPFLREMEQKEFLIVEKGDERIRLIQYITKGTPGFPLRKVTFFLLENGWVYNKDDRNILDEDELLVGTFIPADDIALPFLALEASLHLNKYDHLNVDLFPLSKDQRYRKIFCDPVKELRKKHDGLEGLLAGVRTPSLLGEYTSQGMLAGDFTDSMRDITIPWWFEYVDMYKDFLEKREQYPILKEPAILEEAKKIKEIFLTKYRKETPRILSDIPHLYSEEKGKELGELTF
jgi:hypothetical protein